MNYTNLCALLEAATPGPWHFVDTPYEGYTVTDSELGGIMSNGDYHPKKQDVKLIVEMRNSLPALLDRLDKLEAAVAAGQYMGEECKYLIHQGKISDEEGGHTLRKRLTRFEEKALAALEEK